MFQFDILSRRSITGSNLVMIGMQWEDQVYNGSLRLLLFGLHYKEELHLALQTLRKLMLIRSLGQEVTSLGLENTCSKVNLSLCNGSTAFCLLCFQGHLGSAERGRWLQTLWSRLVVCTQRCCNSQVFASSFSNLMKSLANATPLTVARNLMQSPGVWRVRKIWFGRWMAWGRLGCWVVWVMALGLHLGLGNHLVAVFNPGDLSFRHVGFRNRLSLLDLQDTLHVLGLIPTLSHSWGLS